MPASLLSAICLAPLTVQPSPPPVGNFDLDPTVFSGRVNAQPKTIGVAGGALWFNGTNASYTGHVWRIPGPGEPAESVRLPIPSAAPAAKFELRSVVELPNQTVLSGGIAFAMKQNSSGAAP